MSSYGVYTKYKDSGVAWLGSIPKHWAIQKLKSFFRSADSLFIDGDWIESRDISGSDIKYITTGNIGEGRYKEQGSGFITFDTFKRLECTNVEENDLLISRLNMPIGRCCLSPKFDTPLIVSVDVVVCRMDPEYLRRYFMYQMNSKGYQQYAALEARGATMKRISRTILGNFYLSLPPLPEQTAIARFLDYKVGKIDRFIRKKKQLIKLLNEQKAAIINDAVTKGLDPTVPMKDSGIEWLGEIPAHWEVRKLKYLGKIKSGDGIRSEDLIDQGEFEVFGGNGFIGYSNRFNTAGTKLIIGRVGAKCGNVHLIREKKFISDNALILELRKDENYEYYYNAIAVANLNSLNTSSAQPLITGTKVMNVALPRPGKQEQIEIVDYVIEESTAIEKLIATIQKEIALTEEYRTALIAEAVTGKIDVRGYAVPEEDQAEPVIYTIDDEDDDFMMAAEDSAEYGSEQTD